MPLILVSLAFLYTLNNNPLIPFQNYEPHVVIEKAGAWIKENKPTEARLYYSNPQIAFFTELNPYSNEYLFEWYDDDKDIFEELPLGAWFVWDGHISAQRRLPKALFEDSDHFRLVEEFYPYGDLEMHPGIPYSIAVFERVKTN